MLKSKVGVKVMVTAPNLEVNTSHGNRSVLRGKYLFSRGESIDHCYSTIRGYHDLYIPSSYFSESKQNLNENNRFHGNLSVGAGFQNMNRVYSLVSKGISS